MARRTLVLAALLVALVAATVASLALGAVKLPFSETIDILFGGGGSASDQQIVETLRLPRTVEALVIGAALAVAGAVLQGALGNPLASPDVIGVTGGAGFGAILIIILLPGSIALLPVSALFFGLLAATLVFVFAWSGRNRGSTGKVILAGIAMLSLFTAGTTGLLAAFPERAPSAIFFIAGGLTSSGWRELETIWPYFAAGFLFAVFLVRPLDRLALGDDVAASLGSRPQMIRLAAGIAAALLAAASAIGGAALLAAGDTLARTLRAPIEMPVGPFMVLLGVPLFLWLLRKAV